MGKNYYLKRREIRPQNEKIKIVREEEKKMKKVDEIKNLIDKTFPNIKPQYKFNNKHKYYEVFFHHPNGDCILSINEDSKWIEIKRNIKKIISSELTKNGFPECLICYEEITSKVGYCNVCTFIYCQDCFLKNIDTKSRFTYLPSLQIYN